MGHNCRICHSDNTMKRNYGNVKLVKCLNCDITFLASFPEKESVDNYYKYYYSIDNINHQKFNIELEQRRNFLLSEQKYFLKKIASLRSAPANILDIGCGYGFFLEEAREFGYESFGIEPSLSSRQHCLSKDLKVSESIEQINNKFDIITMFHSLEHFLEPIEVLGKIKKILKPNGYIFIRIPAFDCFWSKLLKQRWVWFQPDNHYFHYSKKSIQNIINSVGLNILELNYNKPVRIPFAQNAIIRKRNLKNILKSNIEFKKFLQIKYERITGVEIYVVAQMK